MAGMKKLLTASLLLLTAALTLLGPDVRAQRAVAAAGPIPVSAQDPSWGHSRAPVTVVVFSDFQCPYCKKLSATVEQLERRYGPRKLRVVYKHFPLPFHKKARPAAEAAAAIYHLAGNAAFWRFAHHAFSTLSRSGGQNDWRGAARAASLDVAKIERRLGRGKAAAKIDADIALGKRIGVRGTPASFVNGVLLSGAQPESKFVTVIDEQLAAAAKARARGVAAARLYATLSQQNYRKPAPPSQARGAAPPAEDTTTVWKVPIGRSPAIGPRAAPVTLVVFSDFQCPFCGRLAPTLQTLRKKYPKQLRVVFKHNPLPFHHRAEPAAELSMSALAQRGNRGFWQAHDLLFANQRQLADADLEQLAAELKLNPAATMRAVHHRTYKKRIEADQDLAASLDARGTPQSFINGRRLRGAQPLERFVELVDEEIVHAKRLEAKGIGPGRIYTHLMKTAKLPPVAPRKTVPAPTSHNPARGPRGAAVTIQAFTDFECPFCGRVQATLARVRKEFGGRVRIVYRHMPLPFHTHAMQAHEAAAEAFRQGGNRAFWKMHDLLYANQHDLDRTSLTAYAKQVGLNLRAFEHALDSGQHRDTIAADSEIADKAGIRGTPAFVINGYYLSGAQPFAKFKRVIDAALRERR